MNITPDLKALKLWLANPGSNESWNQDDVDMCRRALAEIERLEFALSECERASKLFKSALRSRG
jgi:hypothetical protein